MTRARLESSARPLRERTRRWISLRSGGVRINRLVATNQSYQLRGRYQCYTALVQRLCEQSKYELVFKNRNEKSKRG